MHYQNFKTILILTAPLIATLFHFLPVIPTLETAKFLFSIAVWLFNCVVGFLFFRKFLYRRIIKTWIVFILYLVSNALFLFVSFLVMISPAFDTPTIETLTYKDYTTTVYLYNYTCFPPDSATECDTYHGELKFRVNFTPFTNSKFNCPCLFGTPNRVGELVTIPLEANRDQKFSTIIINLKTGEFVKK